MSQFGQYDSVPQRLLQLGGGGKLLPQTRLHPPEEEEEEERGGGADRQSDESEVSHEAGLRGSSEHRPLGLLQPAEVLIGHVLDPLLVHLLRRQPLI